MNICFYIYILVFITVLFLLNEERLSEFLAMILEEEMYLKLACALVKTGLQKNNQTLFQTNKLRLRTGKNVHCYFVIYKHTLLLDFLQTIWQTR